MYDAARLQAAKLSADFNERLMDFLKSSGVKKIEGFIELFTTSCVSVYIHSLAN